jgi:hypothetical protein
MSRATPDQIVAHVDLLRSVDRLLAQADVVRRKRDDLDRLLSHEQAGSRKAIRGKTEGRHDE